MGRLPASVSVALRSAAIAEEQGTGFGLLSQAALADGAPTKLPALTPPVTTAAPSGGSIRASILKANVVEAPSRSQRGKKAFSMLTNVSFYKDLNPEVQNTLPSILTSLSCKAGAVLFRQGDPPGNCYIIASGQIGIFILPDNEDDNDPTGSGQRRSSVSSPRSRSCLSPRARAAMSPRSLEQRARRGSQLGIKTVDGFSYYREGTTFGTQVAVFEPGQVVGELALLNDRPRAATCLCLQDSEFFVIRRADFDNLLKADLVNQCDGKYRFLMEHVPGMREVPAPKPGSTKPHVSYVFKKARYRKDHTFLWQDSIAPTQGVYVVYRGAVEFLRHPPQCAAFGPGVASGVPRGYKTMPAASLQSTGSMASQSAMKKCASMPRLGASSPDIFGPSVRRVSRVPRGLPTVLHSAVAVDPRWKERGCHRSASSLRPPQGAGGTPKADPSAAHGHHTSDLCSLNRRAVVVAGGIFGSLPTEGAEPFTVKVSTQACEVYYVEDSDYTKLPRKLLEQIKEYIAATTLWRVECFMRESTCDAVSGLSPVGA